MTVGRSFSKLNLADDHFVQSKRLLQGLETASNTWERQSVLNIAALSFNHNVVGVHDEEIRAGAATVLCECLVQELQQSQGTCTTEAIRICKILSMIYRCSNALATSSIRGIGFPLVQAVLETASCCVEFRVAAEELIDRLSSLEVPLGLLANCDKLLTFLLKTIQDSSNEWSILHGTRMLAGLTMHSDSKQQAFSFEGLVDTIIDKGKHESNAQIRHEAAVVLRNLAWDSKNKTEMARIHSQGCIGVLVPLTLARELQETRSHALEALKYLSVEAKNKCRLVFHGNGQLIRALMVALMDGRCPITLRLSAIGTLLNLVTRETSNCIGRQEKLLDNLAVIACANPENGDLQPVALLAAQTIKKLATHINVHFRCHVALFQALSTMAQSSQASRGTHLWTCKAYVQQSLLPGCNFFMARCPAVLKILTNLASENTNSQVKAVALEAMSNLANDAANAKKLATSTSLLETLVDCAAAEAGVDEEKDSLVYQEEARRHAVKALLSLASHRTTTKRVAKQFGLVASLATYGISQDGDDELKKAAIQGVLLLAPLL